MKISILLPYKENYSPDYAGAVSIFINAVSKLSKFNKNIRIFGNTDLKKKFSKTYINIPLEKRYFKSLTKIYLNNFLKIENKRKSNIIEIHNRPKYLESLKHLKNRKFVLYFHNDPLSINGSEKIEERISLINNCDKIIFNSNWTKDQFTSNLDKFYQNSTKLIVIHQSTNRKKVNINKKKKIIAFVGKLNSSKGYDLFGKASLKILKNYEDWQVYVFGDEPREKLLFKHPRYINFGFKEHKYILKKLEEVSISVACSRWNEPFGRSSLEASSRGCAVIISDKGGLKETVTDAIIIKNLSEKNIYKSVKSLIENEKKLKLLQYKSLKNFYLTDSYVSKIIDNYRTELMTSKYDLYAKSKKIIHVTNFNIRHNARLFYNTGRRLNNGLIRNLNSVVTLSDRDVISYEKSLKDYKGSRTLNNKLLDITANFKPDLILMGHADMISNETILKIKKFYPNIKFAQWFLDKMDNKDWLHNKKRFLQKYSIMDSNFCTTAPSAIKLNKKKCYYIPNPVDPTLDTMKVFKNKNFIYDIFFAMSHGVHRGVLKQGKIDNREFFINNLIKNNNNIKFDIYGMTNKQPIWADEFKRKLNLSKMAINLSQGKPMKFYSSDRIAQLIGNGILTFVEKDTMLEKIFKNNEVVFYSNINDLSQKINMLMNDDKLRYKIAKAGYIKYHKDMNSNIVTEFMLNKIFNVKSKKRYCWEL